MCGTSPQARLEINENLELVMVHHVAGHDSRIQLQLLLRLLAKIPGCCSNILFPYPAHC